MDEPAVRVWVRVGALWATWRLPAGGVAALVSSLLRNPAHAAHAAQRAPGIGSLRSRPPNHNPGQPVRDDVRIVARVEHSPDYREITVVTTNDLHFPPW